MDSIFTHRAIASLATGGVILASISIACWWSGSEPVVRASELAATTAGPTLAHATTADESALANKPVPSKAEAMRVRRFDGNPIIRPDMLAGKDGANINGPSLVRVPDWVTGRLGRYYLYFAHHGGKYIRLAYADNLQGPWKIHEPGTLQLKDVPACRGHIASPDVVVDEDRREFRMYFHGPSAKGGGQMSFVATSKDGLTFKPSPEILGIFYFRVFEHDGFWYAMAKGGQMYRSKDGLTGFEGDVNPFPAVADQDRFHNQPGSIRHVALHKRDDVLDVYFTRIGDQPEAVLLSRIDLTKDWKQWKASAPELVLQPETEYEGARLPLKVSKAGAAKGPENAVRDPAIYFEDGRTYLIYSVAGESGLGFAELLVSE